MSPIVWTFVLASLLALAPGRPAHAPSKAAPKAGRTVWTLVDHDGKARVRFTDRVRSADLQGVARLSLNLAQGLGVSTTSLRLPRRLGSLIGNAFMHLTPTRIFASGDLDTPSIGEGSDVDVRLQVRQDNGAYKADGQLAVDVPVDLASVGVRAAWTSGESSGNYRKGRALLKAGIQAPSLMQYVPLNRCLLVVADRDDTIAVDGLLAVPVKSFLAAGVRDFLKKPAATEKDLRDGMQKDFKVQVLDVHVEPLPAKEGELGAHLTLTVKDVRGTIRKALEPFVGKFKDAARARENLDKVLSLRIDRFAIGVDRTEDSVELHEEVAVSNADQFLAGYLELYPEVMERLHDMPWARQQRAGILDRWMLRATAIQLKKLSPIMNEAYSDASERRLSFSLRVENAEGHLRANGRLDGSADVKQFMEAARKHGFPVMTAQQLLFTLRSEGERIKGRAVLTADGPWLEASRAPYAEAAAEIPELAAIADGLAHFELKDARATVDVVDGRLEGRTVLQTSDLSALGVAVLARLAPELKAQVAALEIGWIDRGGNAASSTVDVFLTGATQDAAALARQVTRLVGASRNTLRFPVSAADVAPPALTAPRVERSGAPEPPPK